LKEKSTLAEKTNTIFSKDYIICMFANFTCSLNFMSLLTTTSSFAISVFGSSPGAAGFAASLILISGFIARLYAGRYALTFGYKRMLIIGMVFFAVSTFAYLLAGNYLVFCLIRLVNGVAFGLSSNTAITLATSAIPKSRSGEGVGYFSMSNILGTAVGSFCAIQLLHNGGFGNIFLFAALASTAALPFLFFLRPDKKVEPAVFEDESLSGIDKLIERKVLPISALCFLAYLSFSSVTSFVAVYAVEINLARTASYIFVVYAIALLATRPFVSKLFDRRGASVIIYPGTALLAAGFLMLAYTKTDLALILSGVLFGVGLGAVQNGTLALVVSLVARQRLPVANSTYYISLDAATALGPVVTGLLIVPFGFRDVYTIMFVIAACCIPLYYLLFARKAKTPV